MSRKCSPYDVSAVIADELMSYYKEVAEEVAQVVEEVASDLVGTLKSDSPKKTGKYAKSWAKRKEGNRYRVYNKRYQLTHLLEYGHVKKDGGRVNAIPHIRPNEEKAIKQLEEKIERVVKR